MPTLLRDAYWFMLLQHTDPSFLASHPLSMLAIRVGPKMIWNVLDWEARTGLPLTLSAFCPELLQLQDHLAGEVTIVL